MILGPWHVLWACALGAVATSLAVCTAFLWARRNGNVLTKWLCFLLLAQAFHIGAYSAVLIVLSHTGKPISGAGYAMYQFVTTPIAVLCAWFVVRVIRAKL